MTGSRLLPLLLCGSILASPAGSAEKKPDPTAVVRGNTQAAVDLFNQLRQGKEGNLFFSPYSISSALAMVQAGARGDTAKEIATALHFPEDRETLLKAFGALNQQINGEGKPRGYKLSVANALWGAKGYPFLPDFLKGTGDHFGARLEELDYRKSPEAARKHINRWVEQQTNDRIQDLLPEGFVDQDTVLVLTNAIYFKGDWDEQFKKDRTREEVFKLGDGKTVKAPFMHKDTKLNYFETREIQGVELPYKGKELSMVILLPRKADGLAALEKDLSADKLHTWLGQLRRREVVLSLPKFKMTTKFDLVKGLKEMGVKLAFSDRADLSGISGASNLYISGAVHKAFVEVNEEGTEAAAATGIGVKPTSASVDPVIQFRADHPFLFLIRDVRNGGVLFLGRLATP